MCIGELEFNYHYVVREGIVYSVHLLHLLGEWFYRSFWGYLFSYHIQLLTYPEPSILGVSSSTFGTLFLTSCVSDS